MRIEPLGELVEVGFVLGRIRSLWRFVAPVHRRNRISM